MAVVALVDMDCTNTARCPIVHRKLETQPSTRSFASTATATSRSSTMEDLDSDTDMDTEQPSSEGEFCMPSSLASGDEGGPLRRIPRSWDFGELWHLESVGEELPAKAEVGAGALRRISRSYELREYCPLDW